jgi:hypothetical protein
MQNLLQDIVLPLVPEHSLTVPVLTSLGNMDGDFVAAIIHAAAEHEGLQPPASPPLPLHPTREEVAARITDQFGLSISSRLQSVKDTEMRSALAAFDHGIIRGDTSPLALQDPATVTDFAEMIDRARAVVR